MPAAPVLQLKKAPPLPPAQAAPIAVKKGSFVEIQPCKAQRIGLYGPGGVGKSSLACRAPGPVAIFDLDDSLSVLKPTLQGLDIKVVHGITNWAEMLATLNDKDIWAGIKTIVIDSMSRAEQMCVAHTLATVKHEKGHSVTSLEGYGFGKGSRHSLETMLGLLGSLDQRVRSGVNVVLVMHDCIANVPNPNGEDYIRNEPRLQNSGNGNIRLTIKEWLDHLIFVSYDIAIGADGKAKGSGTRTMYPIEAATFLAKSRSLRDPIEYTDKSDELWKQIFAA